MKISRIAAEAWANTFIGLGISWSVTFFIFPVFGMYPSVSESFGVSMLFFFLSFARSYLLRTLFEWMK